MADFQNKTRSNEALDIFEPVRLFATYYPAFTEATPANQRSASSAHFHHFFEILYIESGAGSHLIGDKEYPVEPGDLFIILPGQTHNSQGLKDVNKWIVGFSLDALNTGRSDAYIYFDLTDEFLLLSFKNLNDGEAPNNQLFFKIEPSQRPRWAARFKEMSSELAEKAFGYKDAARALLVLLLTEIARVVVTASLENTGSPTYNDQARELLVKVFRFIETHYTQPISLSEVAKAVGLSPAYLTDRVRRETGRTVVGWIAERRMADARKLLIETEITVNEISALVGYNQSSHFIRQFKQIHALSPQAWRQNYRK